MCAKLSIGRYHKSSFLLANTVKGRIKSHSTIIFNSNAKSTTQATKFTPKKARTKATKINTLKNQMEIPRAITPLFLYLVLFEAQRRR